MQRKWRRNWQRSSIERCGSSVKTAAKYLLPPLMAAGMMLSSMGLAHAGNQVLPTGGKIVNDDKATISVTADGNTMNINQTVAKMIANWTTFSIGNGQTVNFIQPGATSVALNRVLGNEASNIYGHLNANGQVFLINPNGVLFSKDAHVNVGGLVASTLNIADNDFINGNYTFTANGGTGSVENQGTITAADGGYVALLGTNVKNGGTIVAKKGTVALAAGTAVTLDMTGDRLLNVAVKQAAVAASVANHHLIQADGGYVIMTAKAANDLTKSVVNNDGVIQARSIENKNGVIRLDGGNAGVTNAGTLDASGKAAGQTGGSVTVVGDTVNLAGSSKIDVSGDTGGGTALIGGNYQGKGPERNATTTTVEQGATINADAITTGNGGQVVVWANDKTTFNGVISAKGGSQSGDGGSVETSGHRTLTLGKAAKVVTTALHGKVGNWLLDPTNYTIGTGATGANYWNNVDLGNALAGTGITVQTATTGTDAGDITVSAPVAWSSGYSLTLSAYHDINVYADIANSGGATVKLRADNSGSGSGTVSFTDGSSTGHVFTDGAVNIYYNGAATTWDPASGTVTGPYNDYVKKADGATANNSLRSYLLVNNLTDLQNIGSNGVYALGRDLDASATRTWSGSGFTPGAGFNPIYYSNNYGFRGILDGDGHSIANLYINTIYNGPSYWPSTPNTVGLFAYIAAGGTVRNLSLINVDITGTNKYETDAIGSGTNWGTLDIRNNSYYVGGLAGMADSATIDNVYVTGKVTGNQANAVGGLVGLVVESRTGSHDSVINSSSTAAVIANSYNSQIAAGGLIGELNYDSQLQASGKVLNSTDTNFVRNSYSSGPVTVNHTGLSGIQHSMIYAGGLVGLNKGGSIDQSYSTGGVTVYCTDVKSTVYAGGLVGASMDNAFTRDTGPLSDPDVKSTYTGEKISNSYSTGKVSYSGDQTYVGGFAGGNSGASTISQSFWDTDRSGQSKGVGTNTGTITNLTGLKTAQMAAQSNFAAAGWKFNGTDAVWFMIDGYTTPFLRSEYSTRITTTHQLQLMALDTSARYTLAADLDMRDYYSMAPGVGFVPINNFSGSFDGQGHTVSYLQITAPATDPNSLFGDVGLFGRTLSGAAIHDFALANAAISGGGAANTGIVAGYNAYGSQIYDTFTSGTVHGDGGNVGGSVGSNAGTLATSFSSAKVTGPAGTTGGLAGDNSGTISESYLDDAGSVNGSAGAVAGTNTGTITAPTYDLLNGNWVSFGSNNPVLAWTVAPDGTIGLYTLSELQAIQNDLGGSYALRADIDLTDINNNWTPIGKTAANAFTGKLNGGGYSIGNLTINGYSGGDAIGLFGYTQGATLRNLTLTNVNITGGALNTFVGGLAGHSDGGSISNVAVSGTVTAAAVGGYAGGLAGYSSGSIINSHNAAAVKATGKGSYAGGIAGRNAAGGTIGIDSSGNYGTVYNSGTVTVTGPDSYVGGLAGQNDGSITNSFNTGAVTAKSTDSSGNIDSTVSTGSSAGGVAGINTGTIGVVGFIGSTVYNSGAVTTEGDDSFAGGIAGQNIAGGSIGSDNWMYTPVYNTGNVTAQGARSYAGGLAGVNAGNIINQSYAAAIVTAQGPHSYVGGLVGENSGSISSAYFGATDSGCVAKVVSTGADNRVGGIAGANSGSIADTMSFAVVSSTGPASYVGGLIGDNSGSLATSYILGAVQGTADSYVGGLIGANSGSVTDAAWSLESTGQQKGVGTGTDAGAGLRYDQLLPGTATSWTGWSDYNWNWNTSTANALPQLSWMNNSSFTKIYLMFGRVQDGGSGVTVNRYSNGYISGSVIRYQTQTIGADGLYVMSSTGTAANDDSNPTHVMLLTVEGQPYKANAIYPEMPTGQSAAFYDLKKDTLLISVPFWTSQMGDYFDHYNFDFKRLFDQKATSAAVMAALADKYPDLLFTVTPVRVINGDWHDPGFYYENIYLYDLDVAGNFEAQSIHLYNLGMDRTNYITAGSITTHKTAIVNGDITADDSQIPVTVFNRNNLLTRLISVQGEETKYVADGDITITESGNFVIGAGNGEPLIQAGGDITIRTGGMFINWDGPNAIQAGDRYLIYAPDMLLANWISPADPSSQYYWSALGQAITLYFGTRYLDETYETNMQLMHLNDHLVYDTRGGLPGFVLWGYKSGDVPTGSGFIYTADDPRTAAGIAERSWMTPDYFAAQALRQRTADTAQAGGNPRSGAALSPAAGASPSGANNLVTIVDGGVALPPADGK